VEHYVAVVRMDEGFVLVDSMKEDTDEPRLGKVKGLRDVKLKKRRMPYVSSASDIHGMVMALYPDIQITNPHSNGRRMYPYKPDYSFVFTESPHTMPWYRAYIEDRSYAELASYMMPDKGILKAIADSVKRCLHKYTDIDSAAEFVGDLKARMNINGELDDETDTDIEVVKDTLTDTPPRKRKNASPKSTGNKNVVTKVKRAAKNNTEHKHEKLPSGNSALQKLLNDILDKDNHLTDDQLKLFGLSFGRIMGIASGRYNEHPVHSSRFRVIK